MAARLGVSSVFDEDFACNSSQDVAKVTLKEGLNPFYISTFINSKYGRLQLAGAQTGSVQHHTNLGIIKTIQVVVPPKNQQDRIGAIVKEAKAMAEASENFHAQAQSLLAAELGLDKLDLPSSTLSVRSLSEVSVSGRIDAEYFHSQKAYVLRWLGERSGQNVADYFEPIRDIYNPPSRDTGKSILTFDLTDALSYFLDETGPMIPENEIGSLKKWIRQGDVVISRLRSYLREIALVDVPKEVEALGSSEFIVLRQRSTRLCPEAMVVYLRSEPVQTILRWSQDGSNHPRF